MAHSPSKGILFCPKVIYNQKTKMYVMWYNWIATADFSVRCFFFFVFLSRLVCMQSPYPNLIQVLSNWYQRMSHWHIPILETSIYLWMIMMKLTSFTQLILLVIQSLTEYVWLWIALTLHLDVHWEISSRWSTHFHISTHSDYLSSLGSKYNSGFFGSSVVEAPAMFKRNGTYYAVLRIFCFNSWGIWALLLLLWARISCDCLSSFLTFGTIYYYQLIRRKYSCTTSTFILFLNWVWRPISWLTNLRMDMSIFGKEIVGNQVLWIHISSFICLQLQMDSRVMISLIGDHFHLMIKVILLLFLFKIHLPLMFHKKPIDVYQQIYELKVHNSKVVWVWGKESYKKIAFPEATLIEWATLILSDV